VAEASLVVMAWFTQYRRRASRGAGPSMMKVLVAYLAVRRSCRECASGAIGTEDTLVVVTSKLQMRLHGPKNRPESVLVFRVCARWSRFLLHLTDRC
jgi:hypothetical protein